jgi:transcriptional regulator of arginine metabolism
MKTRTQRLLAIRKIIEGEAVSNQEELLKRLDREGFELTQATLSRDLKFLQAGKRPDKEKGYVYTLPPNGRNNLQPGTDNPVSGPETTFPLNGFISMDFAYNMALIRTRPGYAQSIASAIDDMESFEILGTVAGDDTILLIPREGISREDVINVLTVLLPIE